jgi:hypothetical protein
MAGTRQRSPKTLDKQLVLESPSRASECFARAVIAADFVP